MTRIETRAALVHAIRQYFMAHEILEVTTPVLRSFGATDPHLESLAVGDLGYLQTSPEYAMKILLAETQRSLYQICPAFRGSEVGQRHQIEFQMLEWYRVGFELKDLMDDLQALLSALSDALTDGMDDGMDVGILRQSPGRISYRSLFEARYQLNPHTAPLEKLKALCSESGGLHIDENADSADCLDHLFSQIEPALVAPTIVFNFPKCQAALAETGPDVSGDIVSYRFELYAGGLELANAYQELCRSDELKDRFKANQQRREQLGLPVMAIDEDFLSVVDQMPACAGIALGIDRLLMVITGASSIEQV